MSVDLEIVRQLVELEPYEQFSDISVDDLPGDWRGVRALTRPVTAIRRSDNGDLMAAHNRSNCDRGKLGHSGGGDDAAF